MIDPVAALAEGRPVVVHTLPGRARFRVPRVRHDADYAERLAAALGAHAGVASVRVNAAAASVIVTYDALRLPFDELIEQFSHALPASRKPRAPATTPTRKHILALLSGALGLGLAVCGGPTAIAAACIVAAATPIALRAVRKLSKGRLTVETLDTIAITVLALRGSLGAAALTAFLIAGGEYIRALTARRARAALVSLLGGSGQLAWVVRGDRTERVPADAVAVGDIVAVYPGELILVDGVVSGGEALVDQKTLTGESKPVLRRAGDDVFASTLVTEGKLYIRTERAGSATRASRIVQILAGAPLHDTAVADYAQRFADRFVLPTLLTGAAIYALTRDPVRAVAVIVFDFATGVRVSVPTTVLAAMSAAVHRNILIKGGRALEQLARVDTILFDKTGTLTLGTPRVVEVGRIASADPDEVLALAAAAELRLTHPAANAIVAEARGRGLTIPERHDSAYAIGQGVSAQVDGARVDVGSAQHLLRAGATLNGEARDAAAIAGTRGASTVFVARNGTTLGWIAYADLPRPETREVLGALRADGVRRLIMVTGDQRDVATAVAQDLGIDQVEAAVFPERKAQIVRELQERGHVVAVVGDGINDSPALAYADVSISLKDSSEIARETADVVLHGDLRGLPEALAIARHAMRIIRQDLAIVGAPNALGFALAACGIVSPTLAAALNNGSAVAAALNGLRPLSYRPAAERAAKPPATDRSEQLEAHRAKRGIPTEKGEETCSRRSSAGWFPVRSGVPALPQSSR